MGQCSSRKEALARLAGRRGLSRMGELLAERHVLELGADCCRVARSTYSRTAVPGLSYFGQAKTGVVGLHLPKEVIRVERDWSDGEVCQ